LRLNPKDEDYVDCLEEVKVNIGKEDKVNIAASSVGGFITSPSPMPGFYDPLMHTSI